MNPPLAPWLQQQLRSLLAQRGHALLLSGPSGLGQYDLALALATAAVIAWGVVVLGWSPFVVMLLFWFENVVIGVFNVAKMLATGLRLGAAGLLYYHAP